MERREFFKLAVMFGAGAVVNPIAIARAADEDLEALAKKYIPFMTKPVSVTLNPKETHVREVTPTDYDRLVYGNKRASLVMFVDNMDDPEVSPCEGLASVFRALHDKYHDKLDFFVYYNSKYPPARGVNVSQKFLDEGIRATPSIAMYSPFDLLKGETPERNDGKIKRIDILKSGFSDSTDWKNWFKSLYKYWIPTNITNQNGEYVWRINNKQESSGAPKWEKIYIPK